MFCGDQVLVLSVETFLFSKFQENETKHNEITKL